MKTSPSTGDIIKLINGLDDETLTAQEHDLLMQLLENDPEVRQTYLEHTRLLSFLRQEAQTRHRLGHLVSLSSKPDPRARKNLTLSFMAAAAILILMSVAGVLLHLKNQPLRISLKSSPGTQWAITHRDSDGFQHDEAELSLGSRLEISQGVVEFTLPGKVRGVLAGPATIEVLTKSSIELEKGTGWFTVEEAGKGFVVNTPHLIVTDLGTEFGLRVPDYADMPITGLADDEIPPQEEVHVIKGMVEVSPAGGGTPLRLRVGEAITFSETEGLKLTPAGEDGFLRELPSTLPFIHWSFDEGSGGSFASDGSVPQAGNFPAALQNLRKPVSNSLNHVEGRFGNALSLQGLGDWAETAWPGVAGGAPRTVSLWIKVQSASSVSSKERSSIHRRCILSWGLGQETSLGSSYLLDLPSIDFDRKSLGLGTDFAIRNFRANSPIGLADNHWHHLVSVYTGQHLSPGYPEVIHYVDGVAYKPWFDSAPRDFPVHTLTHLSDSSGVRFGITPLPLAADIPTFKGVIDEVYIFEGVLPPRQINLLRDKNKLEDPAP